MVLGSISSPWGAKHVPVLEWDVHELLQTQLLNHMQKQDSSTLSPQAIYVKKAKPPIKKINMIEKLIHC
ncbi:hypothetical protein CEXT_501621 [Caerostris extrusa]|uniref:Uncharacterized protein n=1 Tax=Caerostris extrusa TaxID=172846 RepID=A0AAV4XNU9_CAEEX|nr:hypothetical protein CEXT_501621 [Caerostris extrusa]